MNNWTCKTCGKEFTSALGLATHCSHNCSDYSVENYYKNKPQVISVLGQLAEKDAEIDKLKDALRWREYPKKKPEHNQICLVSLRDGTITTDTFVDFTTYGGSVSEFSDKHNKISHWLPIPPLNVTDHIPDVAGKVCDCESDCGSLCNCHVTGEEKPTCWFQCQNCGYVGEESEIINFDTPQEECPSCHDIGNISPGIPDEETANSYYGSCSCGGFVVWISDNLAKCNKCGEIGHDGDQS